MANRGWRRLRPASASGLFADLAAVVGLVLLTSAAALAPFVRESPLRVALGLPFVLFAPGYAFVAALFPRAGGRSETGEADGIVSSRMRRMYDRGIDGVERIVLSVGVSVAITPLVGLVLNFAPGGISLGPYLVSVSGVTLVATVIAAQRRRTLPEDERFRVPYRTWAAAWRAELLHPDTRSHAVLNVVLVAGVLLAVGSAGYAVAGPERNDSVTEFYLLTENETGALVADGYPANLTRGEGEEFTVGVGNHEHESERYAVVVQLQRVEAANDAPVVAEREELSRFGTGEMAHGETWHRNHTVSPSTTGDRLRLTYLLYRGDPPAEPTVGNAYREVHLWVNVSEPGGAEPSEPSGTGAVTGSDP